LTPATAPHAVPAGLIDVGLGEAVRVHTNKPDEPSPTDTLDEPKVIPDECDGEHSIGAGLALRPSNDLQRLLP